jgi:hypothetical protein
VLRTSGARIDPGVDEFTEELLRPRCRFAAFPWLPSPRHQVVLREMLMEQLQAATSVSLRIFYLLANYDAGSMRV